MRRIALGLLLLGTPAAAGPLDEARAHLAARRLDAARRLLEPKTESSADERARTMLLTRVCNELEDYECGSREGARATELSPESSEAHYLYAVALRIKMQKVSKIKAMFVVDDYKELLERALALDPRNLDAREEKIGFLIHAPGMVGGDRDRARAMIAELEPLDWRRAMEARASLEFQEQREDEAVRTLLLVLEKQPKDVECRWQLAFWYQGKQRYREADEHFAVLALNPDPAASLGALYQRARTRIVGKFEPERAVELLLRFIEAVPAGVAGLPSKSAAFWRLGNAYEQLQKSTDARAAYERALALDPQNADARKSLDNLRAAS